MGDAWQSGCGRRNACSSTRNGCSVQQRQGHVTHALPSDDACCCRLHRAEGGEAAALQQLFEQEKQLRTRNTLLVSSSA